MMKYIVAVLVIIGFTGCFPEIRTTHPLVKIIALDAKTKKPIVGVLSSLKLLTNEKGVLSIPAETELGLALPVSGVYPIERRFSLTKKGYVPQVCLCTTLTIVPICKEKLVELEVSSVLEELTVENLNRLVERSRKGEYGKKPDTYRLEGDADSQVVCTDGRLHE